MNLIDTDRVVITYTDPKGPESDFSKGVEFAMDMYESQPAVEAIPVGWLYEHSCSNIVDLWRKDCQLQDAKDVVCSILKEYNFNSYDEFVSYAWKMKAAAKLVPLEKLNEIIVKKDTGEENENR